MRRKRRWSHLSSAKTRTSQYKIPVTEQMRNPRKPSNTFSSARRRDLHGGMSSMRPDSVSSPLPRSQYGCSPPTQATTPVRQLSSQIRQRRSKRCWCRVKQAPQGTRALSTPWRHTLSSARTAQSCAFRPRPQRCTTSVTSSSAITARLCAQWRDLASCSTWLVAAIHLSRISAHGHIRQRLRDFGHVRGLVRTNASLK